MSTTHSLSGSMQDGRSFTNYSPICQINTKVAERANIESWNSTKYREYLQKNGLSLINSKFHNTPCGMNECGDSGISVPQPNLPISTPYTDESEII